MKYVAYYTSPLGALRMIEEGNALTHLSLAGEETLFAEFPEGTVEQRSTPLLDTAKAQLREYFQGTRQHFDLPPPPVWHGFPAKSLGRLTHNPLWGNTQLQRNCHTNPKPQRMPRRRHGK